MTNSALAEPRALPKGSQTPRVLHRPKFDSESDAHDAIDVMAMCGQTLDLWQCLLVCVTLATMLGRLAATSVAALVARQNGKGGWLEAIAIWSLFEPFLTGRQFGTNPKRLGDKNITLWTAHELKTSDVAYLRVKALIQANDELAAQVVRWDGGLTGQHIIELRDGSILAFIARSKSSGRGFSPRRIICDESQEFSALAHRALMYSTSAQGKNRQMIYTGTVPSEENNAEIFTGLRDAGRAGKGERSAWAEWTPTGSDEPNAKIDGTSWAARAQANPALGSERLLYETLDDEWDAAQSDIDGFLRERLSVWPTPIDESGAVVNLANWNGVCCDPGSQIVGRPRFVLDVPPSRTWAAMGVAGERADGVHHIEITSRDGVIDHRPGVEWVVPRCRALKASDPGFVLTIVNGSSAEALIPALTEAGIRIDYVPAGEVPAACGALYDAIEAGTVRHVGQDCLTDALRAARKNAENGESAWRWGRRKSSADITPLYAVTVALWALKNRPALVEPSAIFV